MWQAKGTYTDLAKRSWLRRRITADSVKAIYRPLRTSGQDRWGGLIASKNAFERRRRWQHRRGRSIGEFHGGVNIVACQRIGCGLELPLRPRKVHVRPAQRVTYLGTTAGGSTIARCTATHALPILLDDRLDLADTYPPSRRSNMHRKGKASDELGRRANSTQQKATWSRALSEQQPREAQRTSRPPRSCGGQRAGLLVEGAERHDQRRVTAAVQPISFIRTYSPTRQRPHSSPLRYQPCRPHRTPREVDEEGKVAACWTFVA
ncbi:hypothetical protein C8Q70DRAFT_957600 [Cubamyces menziesii]|nr:hypothetical protein C8Q70DRAFT_957600 [Cubamyces menziesii]